MRGYCCFVVEKFSTLTRHQVSNNEQHNPRNSVHFELHGIRDRNDRESAVRVIALAIVLGEYTWTGAQVVYNNRRNIVATVNNIRNDVGNKFVYAS